MFRIRRGKADKYFSDLVRELADWSCERCKGDYHDERRNLHLSHFWSRRNKSTRFDRENAASLCFSCHRFFTENPQDHYQFFLKRLGQEKIDALERRAKTPMKVDETELALGFKMELERLREKRVVLK